jgi:hypothetical protein
MSLGSMEDWSPSEQNHKFVSPPVTDGDFDLVRRRNSGSSAHGLGVLLMACVSLEVDVHRTLVVLP